MKRILLIYFIAFSLVQCKQDKKQTSVKQKIEVGLITDKAMIVSARQEASAIGVSILKKGGTAFDAMIATDLALVVAYPFAGNIGGGGFMVYRTKDGKVGSFDYREKAPLAASRDMYLDKEGNVIPDKSILGATGRWSSGNRCRIVYDPSKIWYHAIF